LTFHLTFLAELRRVSAWGIWRNERLLGLIGW